MAAVAAQPGDAARQRGDGARQLRRRRVRLRGCALALLSQGRQVLRRDRRRRRQARRLRGEVHLRPRSAAAVPGRVSRWPRAGAVDRLGQPAGRQGRAALVPPLSQRDASGTTTCCIGPSSNQNWNFMCAECHSMGVRKNYDAASEPLRHHVGRVQCRLRGVPRSGFATRELGARAAAAGGPSARAATPTWGCWRASPNGATSTGRPRGQRQRRAQQGTAGRCAPRSKPAGCATRRRGQLSEGVGAGALRCPTRTQVSSLDRGLYQPDGQMLDEVYNYGSFKQSKMFAAGVTCSDCHEPHSAKLRAGSIDGVCLQCHTSDKYATAAHHRHERADPKLDLRVVPHAQPHLHGDRSAARPQLPRAATRPVAQARHAQRMQRLPHRQGGRLGGRGDRTLAWA